MPVLIYRMSEVAGVAVDSRDRVYVFNRGEHPVIVFDKEGKFLNAWGGYIVSLAWISKNHGKGLKPRKRKMEKRQPNFKGREPYWVDMRFVIVWAIRGFKMVNF